MLNQEDHTCIKPTTYGLCKTLLYTTTALRHLSGGIVMSDCPLIHFSMTVPKFKFSSEIFLRVHLKTYPFILFPSYFAPLARRYLINKLGNCFALIVRNS